jgi:hypothetical protein
MMLSTAARQDLEVSFQESEEAICALARTDIRAFVAYVMRDEETGGHVDLSPMHAAWHALADQYDRLIIWAYMEAGKSFNMSVARTLWMLGRDPSLRIAIVSNTSIQAAKIARLIARYIEESEELHRVFPDLMPDSSMPWNSEQLTVKRPTMAAQPSIQIVGIGSNIQGSRIDIAILDDVLNRDNTRTDHMRKDSMDWYLKTIPGRMTRRGRIIVIGNAFHPQDLMHALAKNRSWHAFKFPIQKRDGSSSWPEVWPPERIQKRREELGPIESKSQLDCDALDDATSRFKRDWIDKCKARGEGKHMVYALRAVPPGCKVYIGVDLAVGRKKTNDRTVYFVILIHPNGDRQVLWIEAGRLMADEIMNMVVDLSQRFQGIFVVENVSAQDYLVQLLTKWTAIPIIPFTTGKNKADPSFGVEAMGVEFANGKWIIPNDNGKCDPEVETWCNEMLAFHPDAHCGDSLIASWFAKEGERLNIPPPPLTGIIQNLKLTNW